MIDDKLKIVEYLREGKSLFEKWFNTLDSTAAAKITAALYKLENGNISSVRSVGKGVLEYKVDFGPGYRIYLGREGDKLIILLGGGTKKTQGEDIKKAHAVWQQYKSDRKSRG